ncbi:unnamed protein product, partial [Rotaria socialis]
SFSGVSPFIDAALITYSDYRIDFTSILKSHFDFIYRHIQPDQVVCLKLSDEDDTP